jgi:hypothetical protein
VAQRLRDGSGERGLTMVYVTDGAYVQVRLAPCEFLFGHVFSLLLVFKRLLYGLPR